MKPLPGSSPRPCRKPSPASSDPLAPVTVWPCRARTAMGDDTGNMGDNGGQAPATTGDGRRLTYAELAARLGISGEAARILVRRRGWQRMMPNHPRGLTVVVVPDDALADEDWRRVAPTMPDEPATEGDTQGGQALQPATGKHLMAGALATLETAVLSLTERALAAERRADGAEATLTEANRRADSALSLAEGTLAQLADANARADRAEGRVSAIEAGLDVARADARAARERAEALQREHDARKARGRLRRAWDGWRGS